MLACVKDLKMLSFSTVANFSVMLILSHHSLFRPDAALALALALAAAPSHLQYSLHPCSSSALS